MMRPRALMLLALMFALARPARAQVLRFGVISDSVRAMLAAAWRDDPRQVERAYCVRRARIVERPVSPTAVDSVFHVLAVVPARVSSADPNNVEFVCARGTPELHTHAPATCIGTDTSTCRPGGPDAYSCQPSRSDYVKLLDRGDQFAVIQCDRHAFRFYFPSDYPHAGGG